MEIPEPMMEQVLGKFFKLKGAQEAVMILDQAQTLAQSQDRISRYTNEMLPGKAGELPTADDMEILIADDITENHYHQAAEKTKSSILPKLITAGALLAGGGLGGAGGAALILSQLAGDKTVPVAQEYTDTDTRTILSGSVSD